MYAYAAPAYWMDMGTPEKYLQMHRDLLSGKCRNSLPTNTDVIIGEHCAISPTAVIRGPAIIGANCTIGPQVKITGPVVIGAGCSVREGSTVADSIIWQNVEIGPQVTLKSSILADSCHITAGIYSDVVLGDTVTIAGSVRLGPGSKIFPGSIVA